MVSLTPNVVGYVYANNLDLTQNFQIAFKSPFRTASKTA